MKNILTKAAHMPKKFLIGGVVLLIIIVGILIYRSLALSASSPQFQTATASTGTLITNVTAAGTVATSNRVSVTTQASGLVKDLYIKTGQSVQTGDKIADLTLDNSGQQRQNQAWAAYLSAQNALNQANSNLYTLQDTLFVTNQKFVNDRGVLNPSSQEQADPVYIEENDAWLAAEAAYKNQATVIAQAQANLTSAWTAYQAASSTITAPSSGTLEDLTVAPGMQIGSANTTTSSSTSVSSQIIGSIVTPGNIIITVNVAEVDAASVKVGQKATVTFDSLPNKTFTGTVTGINTIGVISSGVTTYPATIVLDPTTTTIYANMTATANIITNVENNVLLVPTGAVQTAGGTSTVTVLQNGNPTTVTVTTGDSSATQTVITSGLSNGETVVTGTLQTSGATGNTGSSPFTSALRIGRGFGGRPGGGGAARGGN